MIASDLNALRLYVQSISRIQNDNNKAEFIEYQ